MATPAPRPSLALDEEVNTPATDSQSSIKTRRSSLNFFRRISGDKQSTVSPPRTNMLFKKSAVKEEVTPLMKTPRIQSFHFDNLTNYALQFENNNNNSNSSILPPQSMMPVTKQHNHASLRRNYPSATNHVYNTPGKPAMPPPQTPITPPAQYLHDPFERSTTMSSMMTSASMKDRGRYGYVAPATTLSNSPPRRLRRKKDAQPYNILVIGSKNCGKTSFIQFLRSSLACSVKNRSTPSPPRRQAYYNSSFPSEYLETDIDGERVGLTLYDSPGLEKSIVDLQLSEMSSFIESKFEETFVEEQKVARAAGTRDTHIHCVLLLLDPTRLQANVNTSSTRSSPGISATTSEHGGMLDATIDIDVLRKLNNLTTVVPIISKADTITVPQMAALKHALHEELGMLDFHPLNVLDFDSEAVSSTDSENDSDNDEGDTNSSRTENNSTSDGENRSIGVAILNLSTPEKQSTTLHADITDIPLSIISPDTYEEGLIGRRFPWGFADPNNGAHCDFPRVKELIFNEWRDDLCEASRVRCYEKWRTTRLKKRTSPQTAYARTNSGDVRIARPGTAHRGTSSNDVGNVASATSIRDEQYKSVVSGMQRL